MNISYYCVWCAFLWGKISDFSRKIVKIPWEHLVSSRKKLPLFIHKKLIATFFKSFRNVFCVGVLPASPMPWPEPIIPVISKFPPYSKCEFWSAFIGGWYVYGCLFHFYLKHLVPRRFQIWKTVKGCLSKERRFFHGLKVIESGPNCFHGIA